MKKVFLSLALTVLVTVGVAAQDEGSRNRSVYLELFGASNGVGISYDARFKSGSPWGYRVGLSWAYASSSGFVYDNATSMRAYAIPVGVNYLLGKNRSKLELGAGANLGIYNEHRTLLGLYCNSNYNYEENGGGDGTTPWRVGLTSKTENHFGYFLYGSVGYRHVSRRGFQFRAGVNPTWVPQSKRVARQSGHFVLAPYVSFGWAF